MQQQTAPLNNAQLELLKIFSTDLSPKDLNELKEELAGFYAKKSIAAADKVWDEKKLSNQDMTNWLNDDGQ